MTGIFKPTREAASTIKLEPLVPASSPAARAKTTARIKNLVLKFRFDLVSFSLIYIIIAHKHDVRYNKALTFYILEVDVSKTCS